VNIPIVYEDDWLLVLNKPSGLLTVPTPKNEPRTLTSIVNEDLKKKGLPRPCAQGRGLSYCLYPCHRLDRDTSGLIIYAKGKSMQKKMTDEFKRKRIKKAYIAFVQGRLSKDQGDIRYPIEGRSAITKYKMVEKRNGFSIVEIMPLTGRTNQIRMHFKQIGHPLVGETKFAFRRDFKLKAKRVCLHAEYLEFIHPITTKPLYLYADLPIDLKEFLKRHS